MIRHPKPEWQVIAEKTGVVRLEYWTNCTPPKHSMLQIANDPQVLGLPLRGRKTRAGTGLLT